MKTKITIAIPSYNNENTIRESIESALAQEYPQKLTEILVIDDCSTDNTVKIAMEYPVHVMVNSENMGIGENLAKCMNKAEGKYVIYLCADDIFADKRVVGDVVEIFDKNGEIGVIGRYYYYFMDGKEGAIGTCREKRILIQSCCPSGMAFRNMKVWGQNKIFIEMPLIVSQYLKMFRWTMLEYDTIGARYHPGGNTGTKTSYYTESPTQNWIDLLGENYQDFPMFIQLKNRAPKLLWREICLHVKNDKKVLLRFSFWFHALTSLLMPGMVLRILTTYQRNLGRLNAKIIRREDV